MKTGYRRNISGTIEVEDEGSLEVYRGGSTGVLESTYNRKPLALSGAASAYGSTKEVASAVTSPDKPIFLPFDPIKRSSIDERGALILEKQKLKKNLFSITRKGVVVPNDSQENSLERRAVHRDKAKMMSAGRRTIKKDALLASNK